MQNILRRLAITIAAMMFLIIVMGALVTKTESGLGCGYEWPLCNGKFIPAYTISSIIEYSHRFIVAIFTLLLVITTVLVFWKSGRKDAKWLSAGAVFFTLLQAAMGAFAVVMPQSPPVLAIHFGLSLLAYAFCFLLAVVLSKWGHPDELNSHYENQKKSTTSHTSVKMKSDLVVLIWSIVVFTYIVVYLGAFVRHTQSSGGCSGWPLCNGQWIPELDGATGIVFIHRLAALCLSFAIGGLFLLVHRRYERSHSFTRAINWIVLFLVLQIATGAFVTWSISSETLYLFTAMFHAVIITLLFGFLSYLAMVTFWQRPEKKT